MGLHGDALTLGMAVSGPATGVVIDAYSTGGRSPSRDSVALSYFEIIQPVIGKRLGFRGIAAAARKRLRGHSILEVTMDAAAERQFREFVMARSVALMRLAYLLTGGDQHAAEDLLQTALAKTAARWARVESPETYVRRVMHRQQINTWRLKWRRREIQVAVPPDRERHDDTSTLDLKITVRKALARLTPRQRAVLILRFFEDLPEAEIARLLGCSVGTVRSTTHRSLARLRELAPELNGLNPIEEVLQ